MSEYDATQKYVKDAGGCSDWPCDYACLRRGSCDFLSRKRKSSATLKPLVKPNKTTSAAGVAE